MPYNQYTAIGTAVQEIYNRQSTSTRGPSPSIRTKHACIGTGGHRYVSVRELDNAIADFRRAAELTDGLPNARGIPTSTLQFNIWYHLGLAHYLKGEFEEAAEAYEQCARVSEHDDSKVATAYWRYMTLDRLGRTDEAQRVLESVSEDMDLIESGGCLDLLLLFRGKAHRGRHPRARSSGKPPLAAPRRGTEWGTGTSPTAGKTKPGPPTGAHWRAGPASGLCSDSSRPRPSWRGWGERRHVIRFQKPRTT